AVVRVENASVRGRNLRRPGDDGIEHCLELQRGADGLADLTERSKLIDEARQLPRASLQLDGHLVELGREATQLVAVRYVDALREVPCRNEFQSGLHQLHR